MKTVICVLALALTATSALATPAVGVASFEDGTSTFPVQVWFAPGSVTNVADAHEGTRGVAATGNVRVVLNPMADQTRLVFWMKTSNQAHITGLLQYYDVNWVSLRQDNLDLAVDRVWREQVILLLNKPAGTAHVYAAMYLPSGITATFDDVVGAADNPTGAVNGFESGSSSPWSVWYTPGSVLNTNVVSHAGERSVAVSGNVKFSVAPIVSEARFWHLRASGSATMTWQVQYYDASWLLLAADVAQSATSDTTWRQSTVPIAAPANTRYVLIGVWVGGTGDGATVNVDDFTTTATVQPSVRPFANASPWNVLAADLPLTLVLHTEIQPPAIHWWASNDQIPVVNSSPSNPTVAVSVGAGFNRPATVINVRMPADTVGGSDGDHHLAVNETSGISYDFYNFAHTPGASSATASFYGSTPLDGDGFIDPATGFNAGCRAPWNSPMGGLLSGAEIAAGEIEHALGVGFPGSLLARGWVYPARKEDTDTSNYSGTIPIGTRLVVPSSATMPAGLSPLGQKIWRAAQRYGFIVVDQVGGSSPVVYADTTVSSADLDLLRVWWNGRPADLDQIAKQLQVAQD
jgi:hypothetical protein